MRYFISTGSGFAVGIGLTEVKNAAFGAIAYSSSKTLWGGNGVEPCALMESIFFVRFSLI